MTERKMGNIYLISLLFNWIQRFLKKLEIEVYDANK